MIDFDINKAVETVTDFHRLGLEAGQIVDMCNAEILEADRAIGDLRHYVELKYPLNAKQKTMVIKRMNEYCRLRRRAKDILEVITPLHDCIKGDKSLMSSVSKVKGEMAKANKKITSERVYRPRVLMDIFEEEEDA